MFQKAEWNIIDGAVIDCEKELIALTHDNSGPTGS